MAVSPPKGPLPPLIAILGPTAVGKSALAMAVAERIGGEIVNADAMQLYRGMDIGTAKPTPAERARIRHHLLDVLDVRQSASVAAYQAQARAAILDIRERGHPAVLVGGSGLYVRAVLDDFVFPGTDEALRASLESELAESGPAHLHARLAEVDPAAAAVILPTNGRRIVRALEVVELTGAPFAATLPGSNPVLQAVRVGLAAPREQLAVRISERVGQMWDRGLVAEVVDLLAGGLAEGRTASRALGYSQVIEHLAGRLSAEQARAATVVATGKFARRQLTWFRRDPLVHWLAYDSAARLDAVLSMLANT